jgi:hypothetical protein
MEGGTDAWVRRMAAPDREPRYPHTYLISSILRTCVDLPMPLEMIRTNDRSGRSASQSTPTHIQRKPADVGHAVFIAPEGAQDRSVR